MLNNRLVKKYEASGNPATVSSGSGDIGGRSYGIYQLASNTGSVDRFISWVINYPNRALANYGRALRSAGPVNSPAFIAEWKRIGSIDSIGFAKLQDEYAGDTYYNAAYYNLLNHMYDLRRHSEAMKDVVFSRAVQYGAGNVPELFNIAVRRLGYNNLSYVDAREFDSKMIRAIYNFLIDECNNAYLVSSGRYHSPNDWANGSYDVVKIGLKNRFINERDDALRFLTEE